MGDNGLTHRFKCRVCDQFSDAEVYPAREMMFGTRENFEYLRCMDCGCLQISTVPEDLSRHYPANYYSQITRREPEAKRFVAGWLTRQYSYANSLHPDAPLTALIRHLLPMPGDFAEIGQYLVQARLQSPSERILDVGCGSSPQRLAAMRRCGFINVEGVDPFIAADLQYQGVRVRKCTIEQVEGTFGLVMFHHALEHVPDPVATLLHAARLLRPGGTCLVRVPVMGTYFWRHFGVNWAELDAPRHLHLFSLEAMGRLADRTGFSVRQTKFDSEVWEIAASLRISREVAMLEPDPEVVDRSTEDKVRVSQRKLVDQLNRLGDAGRACFTLERVK